MKMNALSDRLHVSPELGQGVYTYSDAEKILRLPSGKVRSWLQGYAKAKSRHFPAGEFYVWKIDGWRGFNFHTLIEAYVVAQLRTVGVPMKAVRVARDELARRFNTAYPFTMRGLLSDGKKILFQLRGPNSDSALRLDKSGQIEFEKIIRQFCKKIDFGDTTERAERYWPDGRGSAVVVDPHHSFGRPTISGTNVQTEALVGMIRAGEPEDFVARLYGLELKQVRDAARFERRRAA